MPLNKETNANQLFFICNDSKNLSILHGNIVCKVNLLNIVGEFDSKVCSYLLCHN